MLIQIDLNALKKEARLKQVSVYLLLKRLIEYRDITDVEKYSSRNCFKCKLSDRVVYDETTGPRYQCHIVGVFDDYYADISNSKICKQFKKSWHKNLIKDGGHYDKTV